MDAFAESPFALLDVHVSVRLVTDLVHEDDALCLALTCRALRDALGARFPACPRAGGRAVAELAARVSADGVLDLSHDDDDSSDEGDGGDDDGGGLRALPEGFGRLAYLPGPGLRKLILSHNENLAALPAGLWTLAGVEELDLDCCGLVALPEGMEGLARLRVLNLGQNGNLTALPAGLWTLVGLEELYLHGCGLTALPEGIGALVGLRKLILGYNKFENLTALPVGLWTLAALEELHLSYCGLRALPEEMEGLVGLRKLDLSYNKELTVLPAGLGRLRNLEELNLRRCPGWQALDALMKREGLPALLLLLLQRGQARLDHLAAQGGEPAAGEAG